MVKAVYVPPLRAEALSRLVAGTRTFSPLCDATAFKAVVVHFYDPDGNQLEVYCNVPPEEYRKSVSNPYYNYGGIEDELEGKVAQRPGSVVP